MAEHLASILGTEKDRVNYFKIGACRHGDRCSRLHTKPSISPTLLLSFFFWSKTLLLSNMYQRPDMMTPGQAQPIVPRKIQAHFDDFYQYLFDEILQVRPHRHPQRLRQPRRPHGTVRTTLLTFYSFNFIFKTNNNNCSVYVQFREEEHAANALRNLTGRFYTGLFLILISL